MPENLKASVARAEALRPLIPTGMTMPEMALRFILSNPDVSTVIPGMRKMRHVEDNLGASGKGPLDAELIDRLRAHRWDRTAGALVGLSARRVRFLLGRQRHRDGVQKLGATPHLPSEVEGPPLPSTKPPRKLLVECPKDGSVWARVHTRDGVPTGNWEWFHKHGSRMRSGTFETGRQVGEWTTYDEAGRVHKATVLTEADVRRGTRALFARSPRGTHGWPKRRTGGGWSHGPWTEPAGPRSRIH